MKQQHYHTANRRAWPELRRVSREMRRNPTPAEAHLWDHLRRLGIEARFRRQHPIGDFIADFVCLKARLVVEVDGEIHGRSDNQSRDLARDAILAEVGFRVVRYTNEQVMNQINFVLADIRRSLGAEANSSSPLPLSGEGAGG